MESTSLMADLPVERGLPSLVTWGPGEERLADRVVAASEGARAAVALNEDLLAEDLAE